MRACAAVLVAVILLPAVPAGAQGELDDARRGANAVAAELAEAQTRLARLEDEIAALEAQAADGAARRAALEETVRALAVEKFMHSAPPAIPVFDDDLTSAVRADALAGFVRRENLDAVDAFRQAGEDIDNAERRLEALRADAAVAVESLQRRAQAANTELVRLQRLEEERRVREETERRVREDAAAQAAAIAAAPPSAVDARPPAGTAAAGPPERSSASRRAPAPPRAPAPARAAPAPVGAGGAWTCPVQGPRAFSNDWGQPRSGGRRHQGNDILSPRGTPVVASVAGSVRPHQSSMGGISYYLKGDDGNTYFGTHLDSLSGASGRVGQGAVLGYVGNSGNASGGPTHLHFEIHPGGGAAVNPYPTLSQYC